MLVLSYLLKKLDSSTYMPADCYLHDQVPYAGTLRAADLLGMQSWGVPVCNIQSRLGEAVLVGIAPHIQKVTDHLVRLYGFHALSRVGYHHKQGWHHLDSGVWDFATRSLSVRR